MSSVSPTEPPRTRLLRSRIFRLTLIYLCLFSAVVLGLVGFIYWSATASVTRQIDKTIDAEIRGLAEQYRERGTVGLIQVIQQRVGAAGATPGLYLLTDRNLAPLAGNLSRWPDVAPDPDGWVTFPLEFPESEGGGLNFGRGRVFELSGGLYLLVGHDVRERTRIAAMIRETLAWGLLAIIGLSLVGGLLMSRSLLRRIDRVNATSRDIMAGDLSQRVPVTGRGDEFDQLAGNLNAMLDRIERLLAGMKQVSDNIAHDLRSPLTRLRSRLEVTLMERHDEAAYREAIERTIAEADGLLKTFNALLSIAQAESGAPRQGFAPVDLAAVVRDVAELYEPLAEERGLTLGLGEIAPLTIVGDRHLLFQGLVNLLDNAIKFSPAGGQIALSLTRSGDRACLAVADGGAGIPEAARAQVRDRFVRLESSRSTPGSGLGLSLVAAVARLHDGVLRLEDNAPGLRAALLLPLGKRSALVESAAAASRAAVRPEQDRPSPDYCGTKPAAGSKPLAGV